ncbi:MAG TPA: 4Fe-4S dicluster domain-containing protein [Symbiobacteriaceae bacterium]|nr:4Fe-4S dicluster domain-containing protein [Symbiobacteriaceae bacterium]
MPNTFVVANPRKCIGCRSCEIACAVAHLGTGVAEAGEAGTPFQPRLHLVRAPRVAMPVQCRQCDDAPCANVCPVGALIHYQGRVLVKAELCIGCKTCLLACPFGAMEMVPKLEEGLPVYQGGLVAETEEGPEAKAKMVAHKCDLCAGRPGGPACAEVCIAKAFVVVNPDLLKRYMKEKRVAAVSEIARTRRQAR